MVSGVIMKRLLSIVFPIAILFAASPAHLKAQERALEELNLDMREFRNSADHFLSDEERFFLSDVAIQNLYSQWSIWLDTANVVRSHKVNCLLASSLAEFVLLHFSINNPSWAEWGINQLKSYFKNYLSSIDSMTKTPYSAAIGNIEKDWLPKFAVCSAFNELVPSKRFVNMTLQLRCISDYVSQGDKYVIRTAEDKVNRMLKDNMEYFSFRIPPGVYRVRDTGGELYEKIFEATLDSLQFIFFTPDASFNFIPVARVFTGKEVRCCTTLSPIEFELVRLNEGRADSFDGLEFGRYSFDVKPPYKIVDSYRNKLIIPKDLVGRDDIPYMQRGSELFDKSEYDVIYIQAGEYLEYDKIDLTVEEDSTRAGGSR